MLRTTDILMKLLRVALKTDNDLSLDTQINLNKLIYTSTEQGVNSIAVDGWEMLQPNIEPKQIFSTSSEKDLGLLKRDWFNLNLNATQEYNTYIQTVTQLIQFYESHGIRMVVLKGLGLSRYYPIPSHRPCGDIDIYLLNDETNDTAIRADRLIHDELNIKVTKSKIGHHSHFLFNNLYIENHYELSNTYFGTKDSVYLETELKNLINKNQFQDELGILYPNATFNAVFLMWHMATHFCTNGINLRHLCDWMMFVHAEHKNVDWMQVVKIWEKSHLKPFADVINGIIIRKLNANPTFFPPFKRNRDMEHLVLKDILHSEQRTLSGFANYSWYWKNHWKYHLCSSRSWILHTIDSVWMHLFHNEDLKDIDI